MTSSRRGKNSTVNLNLQPQPKPAEGAAKRSATRGAAIADKAVKQWHATSFSKGKRRVYVTFEERRLGRSQSGIAVAVTAPRVGTTRELGVTGLVFGVIFFGPRA